MSCPRRRAPRRRAREGEPEKESTVPDLVCALLLIGGFALLVLIMRGLERL
jgi:hypothetical protein